MERSEQGREELFCAHLSGALLLREDGQLLLRFISVSGTKALPDSSEMPDEA